MNLLLPEQAALLSSGLSPDEIPRTPSHEVKTRLRDLIARSGRNILDVCPLTYRTTTSAISLIQILGVFTGRFAVLALSKPEEKDGFYRNSATEHALFHPDSEDFEAEASGLEKGAEALSITLLQKGINVGQAFGVLPCSAQCNVIVTSTVVQAFDLYNSVALRPGVYHPDARALATDLWLRFEELCPNLCRVLKDLR